MAIIDRREIEFDTRALISVVAGSSARTQAIGLPPLRPTGVAFDTQRNRITFLYGPDREVQVAADRIGALLLAYCLRARIPLPRLPEKEVRVTTEAVMIVFCSQKSDAPSNW